MSEIPSDIASSAAGAPLQSREVAKARDARLAGQANAVERQVKSIDDADSTIDAGDEDSQVFSESEGEGSFGRELSDENTESSPDEPARKTGFTTDNDGQTHLDLQA